MSSILKALKKIEESAPPEESLNPAQAFNPHTAFWQRRRGRRLSSKIIYIGLAAVVVLAGGILIRGWMPGETDPRGGKQLRFLRARAVEHRAVPGHDLHRLDERRQRAEPSAGAVL